MQSEGYGLICLRDLWRWWWWNLFFSWQSLTLSLEGTLCTLSYLPLYHEMMMMAMCVNFINQMCALHTLCWIVCCRKCVRDTFLDSLDMSPDDDERRERDHDRDLSDDEVMVWRCERWDDHHLSGRLSWFCFLNLACWLIFTKTDQETPDLPSSPIIIHLSSEETVWTVWGLSDFLLLFFNFLEHPKQICYLWFPRWSGMKERKRWLDVFPVITFLL